MYAIILVFDEPETVTITIHPHWLIKIGFDVVNKLLPEKIANGIYLNLPKFCYPREEGICHCVRIGCLRKAKKFLRYLRTELRLKKDQISILRSSSFQTSERIGGFLKKLIENHKNENILFLYAGHSGWYLGENNGDRKYLRYGKLRAIFKRLTGNLILINESCHALEIKPYLDDLVGRYLLFGCTRAENVGSAFNSVLDTVLESWRQRKPANPLVGSIKKSRKNKIMDLPDGKSAVVRESESWVKKGCLHALLDDSFFGSKRISLRKKSSLRRGSPLDYLCYPPR